MKGEVPQGHGASGGRVPPPCPGSQRSLQGLAAWSSRRTQGQSWKRGWAFWARAFSLPFPPALFCCEEGARSWAVETGVAPDMGRKASRGEMGPGN